MRSPPGWPATPALWTLAVVAVLYLIQSAQSLLIPIAVAILLSYALAPVVTWLERRRLGRMVASVLVVLVVFGSAAWAIYAMSDQIAAATETLPAAARRFRATMLKPGSGATANIRHAFEELTRSSGARGNVDTGAASAMAVPGGIVQYAVGSIVTIAGDVTVVLFLVFFLLFTAPALRARALEIVNGERRKVLTTIVDDVNAQIQRFLLVRAATSILVGLATWGALAWLGVEQAAFWGSLAGAVNSIPYFGPVVVSVGLLGVGLVQEGDWTRAFVISGAALAITSIEGWLVTPPLLGKAERMNVIVVFLGVLLWTWLWGPWGTLLGVPMLVVVKSVCDHVERLQPVARLMGPL